MKIALLNLPFDNNYGGNLQRYALYTALTRMGYDITYIYLCRIPKLKWYLKPYSYTKRIILHYFLGRNIHLNEEKYVTDIFLQKNEDAYGFMHKYMKHTSPCYGVKDIVKECNSKFDAYVVGSDQVWRPVMARYIGVENYFLKFTKNENVKRIAYAVSLGTDKVEFSPHLINRLSAYYSNFDKVSVREDSALDILKTIQMTNPQPEHLLDPTFLLEAIDYETIITQGNTYNKTEGKIFCYILDMTEEKSQIIKKKARKLRTGVVIHRLDKDFTTIPQWLANIRDAKYVITDSYHGLVFSIIFKKEYLCLYNTSRGNSRFESLFRLLSINNQNNEIDYTKLELLKQRSVLFLSNISK